MENQALYIRSFYRETNSGPISPYKFLCLFVVLNDICVIDISASSAACRKPCVYWTGTVNDRFLTSHSVARSVPAVF